MNRKNKKVTWWALIVLLTVALTGCRLQRQGEGDESTLAVVDMADDEYPYHTGLYMYNYIYDGKTFVTAHLVTDDNLMRFVQERVIDHPYDHVSIFLYGLLGSSLDSDLGYSVSKITEESAVLFRYQHEATSFFPIERAVVSLASESLDWEPAVEIVVFDTLEELLQLAAAHDLQVIIHDLLGYEIQIPQPLNHLQYNFTGGYGSKRIFSGDTIDVDVDLKELAVGDLIELLEANFPDMSIEGEGAYRFYLEKTSGSAPYPYPPEGTPDYLLTQFLGFLKSNELLGEFEVLDVQLRVIYPEETLQLELILDEEGLSRLFWPFFMRGTRIERYAWEEAALDFTEEWL